MKCEIPKIVRSVAANGEPRLAASDIKSRGEINEHTGERPSQGLIDRIRDSHFVPYDVRINLAPNGTDAHFTGYKGESKCIPNLESGRGKRAADALKQYGQDGVEFKDGFPDFSKVAEATVKIDNMSVNRLGPDGNFAQAKEKLAEHWNKTVHGGRSDWSAREVGNWCKENNLTIHEREDTKTCDFINRDIHETFRHSGGFAECKARDAAKTGNGFIRGADFLAIFDN